MNEWLPRVYRCCGRCCHPDAFPSRIRGSGRRPMSASAPARGHATRQPGFGVVTGDQPQHATLRQASRSRRWCSPDAARV